jgi:hypothetical protein
LPNGSRRTRDRPANRCDPPFDRSFPWTTTCR